MDGDEILRLLKTQAPLDGVVRIHTFKGTFEGSMEEITIEVRYWEEVNGRGRYLIHALTGTGERVVGTNPYASLETAIKRFPWYAVHSGGES